jgi:hypothetical protein
MLKKELGEVQGQRMRFTVNGLASDSDDHWSDIHLTPLTPFANLLQAICYDYETAAAFIIDWSVRDPKMARAYFLEFVQRVHEDVLVHNCHLRLRNEESEFFTAKRPSVGAEALRRFKVLVSAAEPLGKIIGDIETKEHARECMHWCWTQHEWIGPVELEAVDDLPRLPGLYALVAYKRNVPAEIPRFLSSDPSGLVYVGKATRIRGRARALAKSYFQAVPGHMAGRNLERIDVLREQSGLPTVNADFDLRIYYTILNSVADAEVAETDLLHTYISVYGEVPPMNSQGSWREIS